MVDSNTAAYLEGIVELFEEDATTGDWNLVATVPIQNDPNNFYSSYDFANKPAGSYLVKATLDAASPFFSFVLPTYHYSTVLWNEADAIILPNNWNWFDIVLTDGQNLASGSGNINGTVTDGDGLTANDGGDRSGAPRPNTSVLLFDSNEQPITHTVTDDLGQYSFANLPFGTYKLMVEIVGVEQAERWVTLSAANPASNGNDFEVTEDGIVLGIHDFVAESDLSIYPNPTSHEVNLAFESTANFDAIISVARADGQTVLVENQAVAKGRQSLKLDLTSLPSGLYFLQVTTGNEVISKKIVKQ